jgi:hypothetical protein
VREDPNVNVAWWFFLYPVAVIVAVVLAAWAVIMWIRVAYRWLARNPAPGKATSTDAP